MRFLIGILFLVAMPWARAASFDAALVTQLQGSATVETTKGDKRPAVPFLKLAMGEKLHLAAGAQAQIVFFESGRQENWSGGGVVMIDEREGKSASLAPKVKSLPPLLVKQLARTPGAGQQGRAGMVVMRSLPTPDKVAQLESRYAEFRKEVPADDLTPEMFYLSGLIELKETDRAATVLAMLRARQSEPAVQPVVDHFTALAEGAGRAAK